jgi:hypothetical protein
LWEFSKSPDGGSKQYSQVQLISCMLFS